MRKNVWKLLKEELCLFNTVSYRMVRKVSSLCLEWTGRNKFKRAADSDFKG